MNPSDEALRPAVRSRLRLRHFELFRQVCELSSMRKAAAAVHMTQPAATKLIQELEEMFQAPLFRRTRRGMQITPQGEILRRHIGVVMTDIGNIATELDRYAHGGGGDIRLGIIPSLSPALLAQSTNALLREHPGTRFSMQEGTADALMEQLARNELDISFGRVLQARQALPLRVTPVYTEAFDIVCAREHPLARQPALKWKDLAGERWALPAVGTPLREIADSLFISRGDLRPEVAVASSSFHQMRYVIGAGELLGVLPHSIAQKAQADGELAILAPPRAPRVAPICLMVRADIEPLPVVSAFERTVQRTARALGLT